MQGSARLCSQRPDGKLGSTVEGVLVSALPTSRLVRDDADCLQWTSSWAEQLHLFAHDRHGPKQYELYLFHSALCLIPCQPVRQHTSPDFLSIAWWQSTLIIDNEPPSSLLRSVVLHLGGFHTKMSFLGCIGRLIAGSGLELVLEVAVA